MLAHIACSTRTGGKNDKLTPIAIWSGFNRGIGHLAINQQVVQLRTEGKEVFHFGFGESPFPAPPALENALAENAHRKSYLPTLGLLQLREAISGYYGVHFGYQYDAQDILVGPGSKELLFQLLFMLEGCDRLEAFLESL